MPNYRLVTDGFGLPFMMVGMILFAVCWLVYVIVSLLTPAPSATISELQLDSPVKAIFGRPLTGMGDARVFAIVLLVVIAALYTAFR